LKPSSRCVPREHWVKRKLRPADAYAEADRVAALLTDKGALDPFKSADDRKTFLNGVSSGALTRFDAAMRLAVIRRQLAFEETLAGESVRFVGEQLLAQIDGHHGWLRPLSPPERTAFLDELVAAHRGHF